MGNEQKKKKGRLCVCGPVVDCTRQCKEEIPYRSQSLFDRLDNGTGCSRILTGSDGQTCDDGFRIKCQGS